MKRMSMTRFQRAQSSQIFGQSAKDRKPVAKTDTILPRWAELDAMMLKQKGHKQNAKH
jgi:hypothetical protein